ncbi:MAG: cyclic pyranopterin monophosphate synthase MoaC [Gammaproteobacteria bacterium]|jgi:cyclic pyranopterin phosphate synthase
MKFSHVDKNGNAKMVDVSDKKPQLRIARASGTIKLNENTIKLIKENQIKKGDVLTVAKIAGINAAKLTQNLIPLCHTLLLNKVDVIFTLTQNGVHAESIVKSTGKTGVEMEALTAISTALLTIYDMCKAVDKNMMISDIKLIEKVKEDVE